MTIVESAGKSSDGLEPVFALRRVLHPCDLSGSDQNAFLHALRIAIAANAELDLVHVRTDQESEPCAHFPSVMEPLGRWGMLVRGPADEGFGRLGMVSKEQFAGEDPVVAIEARIRATRPDIMVVSTHQRTGWDRVLHGSMAEPLARNSSIATLFIPRRVQGFVNPRSGRIRLKNVLIPVGSKAAAEEAVRWATLLPLLFREVGTHFTVLHVGEEIELPNPGEALQWTWTAEHRAARGDVADHIRDAAHEIKADLIVMTTGGHHDALDAVRGSITERVVREAKCAVLAAPYGLARAT
jgi:nucleotide-binding universal stress UspA family protein